MPISLGMEMEMKEIKPYLDAVDAFKKKGALRGTVKLAVRRNGVWFTDTSGKEIIINAPPPSKYNVAALMHYLAHIMILQEGWPRFSMRRKLAKETKSWKAMDAGRREALLFSWTNRAGDSFFDFYVFKWLNMKFGTKYLREFTSFARNADPESLLGLFKRTKKATGFGYDAYAFCLDYFAMFYELCLLFDRQRAKELDCFYSKLKKMKGFKEAVLPDVEKRVIMARKFYAKMAKKYPSYKDVASKPGARKEFVKFYKEVWRGTGLSVDFWEDA